MARLALDRIGSHPLAVWAIKHLISPLDRFVVRISRGRIPPPSSLAVHTLLMTTTGRRSGQERTTPLVYLRDGDRFLVANARPGGERRNPWVLNLRAAGRARVKVRGRTIEVTARELDDTTAGGWWSALVEAWPAFAEHFAATGERTVFILEPMKR
jgi:deazaflavin-dependent oxidoreductase (nitroreductase family)